VHPTEAVLATSPASSPSWISKTPNVRWSRMQRLTMSV
jgi:hypothetical protein